MSSRASRNDSRLTTMRSALAPIMYGGAPITEDHVAVGIDGPPEEPSMDDGEDDGVGGGHTSRISAGRGGAINRMGRRRRNAALDGNLGS